MARERAREAEDLRHGVTEIERAEPAEGEDIELVAEEERLANADALHAAATTAHEALAGDPASGSYDAVDVTSLLAAARSALDVGRAARHPARRRWRAGSARRPTCLPTWPPSWPPTSSRSRPTRSGWAWSRRGGPS